MIDDEFRDPELARRLGRLAGSSPEAAPAMQQVQRRVVQVRRRRVGVLSAAGVATLLVAVIAFGPLKGSDVSIGDQPGTTDTDVTAVPSSTSTAPPISTTVPVTTTLPSATESLPPSPTSTDIPITSTVAPPPVDAGSPTPREPGSTGGAATPTSPPRASSSTSTPSPPPSSDPDDEPDDSRDDDPDDSSGGDSGGDSDNSGSGSSGNSGSGSSGDDPDDD